MPVSPSSDRPRSDRLREEDAVALLRWALPRLGLRWEGFARLRRQVCRRIARRARELGVTTAAEYRARLEADVTELERFDAMCFVTISRFYRDAATFEALGRAMARLARGVKTFRVWSAGCASGEEPYTVAIVWSLAVHAPETALEVLATDRDPEVLARARRGVFGGSSLRELPPALRAAAFDGDVLRPQLRAPVRFEQRDVRVFSPPEPQHVVLCRNVAFTYFDERAQREFAARAAALLVDGGLFVVGKGESLPADTKELNLVAPLIYSRAARGIPASGASRASLTNAACARLSPRRNR